MSTTREAASCAVIQEFHNILWIANFRYRVHKSPSLVSILGKINNSL
jgi:hypothetical protein